MSIKKISIISALLFSGSLGIASDKLVTQGLKAVKAADMKFEGPDGGSKRIFLRGYPTKAQQISTRVKHPKCYVNAPRSFGSDLHITVLSGNINVGEGNKIDKSKTVALGTGDFYFVPAGTVFFDLANEETTLAISYVGPRKITLANPADEEAMKKPEFHKCQ